MKKKPWLNSRWHETHRMPKNPTPAQRLTWHTAHAAQCQCRPFTAQMRRKLQPTVRVAR